MEKVYCKNCKHLQKVKFTALPSIIQDFLQYGIHCETEPETTHHQINGESKERALAIVRNKNFDCKFFAPITTGDENDSNKG